MEWFRGDSLGYGSFSTVSEARPTRDCSSKYPPLMAVKSCSACDTSLLENEKEVLSQLGSCPQIVQCLGDGHSVEKNERFYNLLLEYAAGGSLARRLKKCGGSMRESEVKAYTRSILKGLRHIHARGFVHCDLKLDNILVCEDGEAKIADFGLSKRAGEEIGRMEVRGTPLYMSPESVNDNQYEAPCDLWALGCAVLEMVTGKPAWNVKTGANMFNLLIRIGVGEELPVVPQDLSDQGKDFLSKCFVKDPSQRWTAEMLLDHPFVSLDQEPAINKDNTVTLKVDDGELMMSSSPRGPFDFPDWVSSTQSSSPNSELWSDNLGFESSSPFDSSSLAYSPSPADRIRELVSDLCCDWTDSASWVTVR
ncbi:hypothetical protein Tsubulata_035486 [Turnera subulata]|uniref:Protein kinase domain-containing protein n=1 Tax=Turnera subulata TaxID=218843 RepID=A0A9Q0FS35_9ROSI|nr:hypothetical protein Tsubulata_035486 [Turnera subulata]